ncbi:hypothetical protein [Bradyrhizobium embrapense]|uniref:hypothetical protein n=1 Tax=Bradyrhizobium embrapense TaxID=630921 RepID=UPI0012F47B6C|nr:hypothetical protein [Bradyrhizobium embrapense]
MGILARDFGAEPRRDLKSRTVTLWVRESDGQIIGDQDRVDSADGVTGQFFVPGTTFQWKCARRLKPLAHLAEGRSPAPSLSRRSVVATMLAGLAPAAGAALIVPAAEGAAAPPSATTAAAAAVEDPALLALGAELDERQAAYRTALARLEEARATATELWPELPTSIVIASAADRRAFHGCFERATPLGGEPLDRAIWPDVLKSNRLRPLLAEVRKYPEDWGSRKARQRLEADLTARINAAERYETACAIAIDTSGIATAKDAVRDRAREIHSLLSKIRKHPPCTVAGVLILARAVALFEEVQRSNHDGGEQGRGLLLGRELADAVLRVANVTA